MHTYEVSFTWKGSRYTETFAASSSFAARRLVADRFPGCSIWSIRQL